MRPFSFQLGIPSFLSSEGVGSRDRHVKRTLHFMELASHVLPRAMI